MKRILELVNKDEEELFVGSLDLKALYSSLDIPLVAKLCGERVARSGLKMEGINYWKAVVYIALTNTQKELNKKGIRHLMLDRMKKQGNRPTVLTWKMENKKKRWSWQNKKMPEQMNGGEKRIVMKEVVESMTMAVFQNHFYRWEGKNFRQVTGGGIGLRATGSDSKVTMNDWAEKFEELLKENEIECFLFS